MKILIEIGHPAHVHFFRRMIERLNSDGDKIIVVTRNKEMTNRLLDEIGIEYISLSTPSPGKMKMLAELFRRWLMIWRMLGRENVDVVASISGISTAVPSWLRGIPNLTITDTEDARISNYIAFPFSDHILTPDFFLNNLGPKQVRYFGLHELAYLKHFRHEGLPERLSNLGLSKPYFIIRLIAYDAAHDWSVESYSEDDILHLIHSLEQWGAVYISSQKKLSGKLKSYELRISIARIHDVLAGALAFIGESPTMAVESGLLGTPSYLISSRSPKLGNMIRLEERKLLKNATSFQDVENTISQVDDLFECKRHWSVRAEAFRNACMNMEDYIVESIRLVANGKRPRRVLESESVTASSKPVD